MGIALGILIVLYLFLLYAFCKSASDADDEMEEMMIERKNKKKGTKK